MKPENAVTILLTVWLIVFFAIAKCVPNAAGAFFGSIIWTLVVVIYAVVSDYIEDIKKLAVLFRMMMQSMNEEVKA